MDHLSEDAGVEQAQVVDGRGPLREALDQVQRDSKDVRLYTYKWLFKTKYHLTQDRRIRHMIELRAYESIGKSWRALGYPFDSITPSYGAAIGASVKTVIDNPRAMALWGMTVAVLLFLGSLPFFLGLVIVMPVLGHATWHMYRKAIERDPSQEYHTDWPANRLGRPASQVASAHSVLFPWPKG